MKNSTKKHLVVLMGIFFSSITVTNTFAAPPPQAPPTVRVAKVDAVDRSDAKTYVANVVANKTIRFTTRISGTLEKNMFDDGAFVKAGQQLFQIEDTIYKQNLEIAKATMAQIEAELEFATAEKNRYVELLKKNATSKTQALSVIRTYNLQVAKKLEAAARLKLAENDLSYTKIFAPFAGKVSEANFSSGNYITPSSGVLTTLVQHDPIRVRFAMSEVDYFRYIKNGKLNPKGITIVRADGTICQGNKTIAFVDNNISKDTGTILIDVELPNKDFALIPGGFATVKFSEIFEKALPAVPTTALFIDADGPCVYVLNDKNIAQKRKVTLGSMTEDRQTITSGVKIGETVIISGQNRVRPNSPVTVVK